MGQHFWLARCFRSFGDINIQFNDWRMQDANPRVHATTRRVAPAHRKASLPAVAAQEWG